MTSLAQSSSHTFGRFYIGVAAFLVVATALLAWDESIYRYVHTHWNHETRPVPTLLKLPHRLLRSAEDWGENVFIVCVTIAMWQFDRTCRSRVLLLFVAALLTAGVVEGLKRATGRERPDVTGGRSVFHGPAAWGDGGDYYSFPSGHAAAGASYSGSLAAFYPPIRPVVVALALGCAGNRIWKERHFASDCFVSVVLGFWLAFTLPRWRWVRPMTEWFDRRFSEERGAATFPSMRKAA